MSSTIPFVRGNTRCDKWVSYCSQRLCQYGAICWTVRSLTTVHCSSRLAINIYNTTFSMQQFRFPLMKYVYIVVFRYSFFTLSPLDCPVFATYNRDTEDTWCCICNRHTAYLLTYLLSPWSRVLGKLIGSSQEIPRILWNPKDHYRIHKCPPHVPILRHQSSPCPHIQLPKDSF